MSRPSLSLALVRLVDWLDRKHAAQLADAAAREMSRKGETRDTDDRR